MDNKREELMENQENAFAVGKEEAGDGEKGEEESLVIKLKKPYLFEKKEYAEIDLTSLEDLTGADLIALEKQYNRKNPGVNVMPELSVEYAHMMAARAAKLPLEFFYGLPPKEANKVKNRVMGFLFGSD